MSYIKAADVLPEEIIEIIQNYVEGEYLYIPRRENMRKSWGENTNTRQMIVQRNREIYQQYQDGISTRQLSERYYLSPKSIQKIVAKLKYEQVNTT